MRFSIARHCFLSAGLLLPLLSTGQWLWLFGGGALAGHLANNLFGNTPAVGISAAVLAMLGCAIFPFGKMPVKLLLIHDILRLPPFRLSSVAAFFVALDIIGIIFNWHFFAHKAHTWRALPLAALWLFAFSPPFVITATLTQSAASLSVG